MGIDAMFYVKTERDLMPVFKDLWWKTRPDKIYVNKIPHGYEYYNLDRYFGPGYQRGYMPRLYVMFQVVNMNLIEGEHIWYASDITSYRGYLRDPNIPDPTTKEDMQGLLDEWCLFMGLGHMNPTHRWDSTDELPMGYQNWDRVPKVVMSDD